MGKDRCLDRLGTRGTCELAGNLILGGIGSSVSLRAVRTTDFAGVLAALHQPVVQPVAGECLAGGRFGLRQFVLMMRKHQIEPAAVNVDRLAQMLARSWPSIRYASRAGPDPKELSQAGSPALDDFHSAKSAGFCFRSFASTRVPAII